MNINLRPLTLVLGFLLIPLFGQAAEGGAPASPEKHRKQPMTPEQREEFFKAHPEAKEKMEARKKLRESLKNMTPEQREAFFKAHPEIKERKRERLQEKLKNMTPEQREAFFKEHPKAKARIEKRVEHAEFQ
jgi:ABC-type transporter MlaC component